MVTQRCDNCVYMIRHHHKLAQLIARPVKTSEAGLHDGLAIWLSQNASPVICVKPAIDGLGEPPMIFLLLADITWLWI